jgi:hypothetical protein
LRFERTVGSVDSKRPLDYDDQRKQRGEPHKSTRNPRQYIIVVKRKCKHHHHKTCKRKNLIDYDTTAHLDAQIFCCDRPRNATE